MSTLAVINRVAVPHNVETIREELGDLCLDDVKVYIDEKNKKEIEEIIALNPRKCNNALALAMQNKYIKDLYGKEKLNEKTSHMTAIKFKSKLNYRIYCQEIYIADKKVIIMCVGYHKKTQQAKDAKTTAVIEAAAKHSFFLK